MHALVLPGHGIGPEITAASVAAPGRVEPARASDEAVAPGLG